MERLGASKKLFNISPQRMSCINLYLEDGSERRDPDSGADEDGVLGAEDVRGGRAEGAVHVNLKVKHTIYYFLRSF